MEVIIRALSTSDLPLLAGDVVGIAIRRTYEAQASPILALFGTRELPDFRPFRDALVDWTTLWLDKVNELGEYKTSYVSESGEEYRLCTIGGITGISRQVWINTRRAAKPLRRAWPPPRRRHRGSRGRVSRTERRRGTDHERRPADVLDESA